MKPTSRIGVLVLMVPALAIYVFGVVVPFIGTFGLSFFRWNGFGTPEWAGLDNYTRAFADLVFRSTFVHVGIYIAVTLLLEVAVGLVLAGFISASRGTGFHRVALFIPVMLPMVVVAVLWRAVYNPDSGILNALLAKIGLGASSMVWLGDPRTALLAISIVSGWVFAGFFMAIFLAALHRLPADVIESARLDGAGEMRIFWRIKVPMIRPVTLLAVLLCVTGGLQGFDLFYVMTNGGPYNTTEVPTTYMVKAVFRDGEIGYGSALSVLVTIVGLAIAAVFYVYQKRNPVNVEY
jgi:raffinose/stachyose/melibiose transport system permease protein